MDDAFGRALYDYHHDRYTGRAIYHRAHGPVDEVNVTAYFDPPSEWTDHTSKMVSRVEGLVLDIGCGAGRTALALQRDGHELFAVDRSPHAVRTARERGITATAVMDLHSLGVVSRAVDTILIVGQQHCAVTSPDALQALLDSLLTLVTPAGRLVADFSDPTHDAMTDRADALDWLDDEVATHQFKIEYDDYTDPWETRLLLAPSVLKIIVAATGWTLEETISGAGSTYAVTLQAPN